MNISTGMCWDTDIEQAMINLQASKQVRDHHYWSATVEQIEAGINPTGHGHLTKAQLNAWVERCQQQQPQDQEITHETHKARKATPNRSI